MSVLDLFGTTFESAGLALANFFSCSLEGAVFAAFDRALSIGELGLLLVLPVGLAAGLPVVVLGPDLVVSAGGGELAGAFEGAFEASRTSVGASEGWS